MLGWELGPPKEGHCRGEGLFPQGSGGASSYDVPWAWGTGSARFPGGTWLKMTLKVLCSHQVC